MNLREKIIFHLAGCCGHDFKTVTAARTFPPSNPVPRDVLLERFRDIFSYARSHVPYYQAKYARTPMPPGSFSVRDIQSIPFISKEEISRNCILSDERKVITGLESGGTTGEKVITHLDRAYLLDRYGSLLKILYSLGWTMGDPVVAFHPIEYAVFSNIKRYLVKKELGKLFFDIFQQYVLYRLFHHRINVYYDRSVFRNPAVFAFSKSLAISHPRLLISRPDVILSWIKQSQAASVSLPEVPVILCVGNILTASAQTLIESTLKGKCFNLYASTEMGYVGLSCEDSQDWVHIDEENYFVELAPSGSGEVVITDLRNRAMPLIRYKTGDIGIIKEADCRCGKKGKLLRILGRVDRFLIDGDGNKIYESHVMNAFVALPGVLGLQVQRNVNNLANVKVAFSDVQNSRNTEILSSLVQALSLRSGSQPDLSGSFRVSDSGKFPYID